jgi:hypothetical protein
MFGEAVRFTEGVGLEFPPPPPVVTVTVADAVDERPSGPTHTRVNEPEASGVSDSVPERAFDPDHKPEAVHDVASETAHTIVV